MERDSLTRSTNKTIIILSTISTKPFNEKAEDVTFVEKNSTRTIDRKQGPKQAERKVDNRDDR